MTEVCRRSDLAAAVRVADICAENGTLKKSDFLRELKKLQ